MTSKQEPALGTAERKGFLWGLIYGLIPHTFCILFIVFSILGATLATSFIQQVLLVPYLFQIIVALSLATATVSALFYLKRNSLLSWLGIKRKWRYLGIMYGTTVAVNLIFFLLIFPAVANLQSGTVNAAAPASAVTSGVNKSSAGLTAVGSLKNVTLAVNIPCSGHAPLILNMMKKIPGIASVKFVRPNLFEASYDPNVTDVDQILAQPVFESFAATVR